MLDTIAQIIIKMESSVKEYLNHVQQTQPLFVIHIEFKWVQAQETILLTKPIQVVLLKPIMRIAISVMKIANIVLVVLFEIAPNAQKIRTSICEDILTEQQEGIFVLVKLVGTIITTMMLI